jgi:hypothetical protein
MISMFVCCHLYNNRHTGQICFLSGKPTCLLTGKVQVNKPSSAPVQDLSIVGHEISRNGSRYFTPLNVPRLDLRGLARDHPFADKPLGLNPLTLGTAGSRPIACRSQGPGPVLLLTLDQRSTTTSHQSISTRREIPRAAPFCLCGYQPGLTGGGGAKSSVPR